MNDKNRMILMALVLIAALGYAAITYWPIIAPLLRVRSQKKTVSVTLPAPPQPRITASIEAAARSTAEALEMQLPPAAVNLVDPFNLRITVSNREEEPVTTTTLPTEKRAAPVEPELQGIWMDSGMNIAFISDQSLQIGGTILGWKLAAIAPDHVVMKRGGATKILYLK
jgi:hypothetical protein